MKLSNFFWYLKASSKRRISNATFVSITGSSGKSTTTALLAEIMRSKGKISAGIIENTFSPVIRHIGKLVGDEDYVILETGTFRKGDIARMAAIACPDLAVVTMVANEHYSSFRGVDAVADEKADLVRCLRKDGLAVLNFDDPLVWAMRDLTPSRCVAFGHGEGADYRITSVSHRFPGPLRMEIQFAGRSIQLESSLNGPHFQISIAAAFAAAIELGIEPEHAAECISRFQPVFNRLSVLESRKGQTFLLDAAKAPMDTIALAFQVMAAANAPYKRIVLGSLADYSHSPRKVYRKVYQMALESADEVIFIGPYSKHSGAGAAEVASGRFRAFDDVHAVSEYLKSSAIPGEVVLLKSSAAMHLERIALNAETEVRCWIQACGFGIDCRKCGLFEHPFEMHSQMRKAARKKVQTRSRV